MVVDVEVGGRRRCGVFFLPDMLDKVNLTEKCEFRFYGREVWMLVVLELEVEVEWRLKLVSPYCECELASADTLKRKNESLQTGGNLPLIRAAARPNLTGGPAKCKAADALPSSRLSCTVSRLGASP
jgi:hypothetical protein